jgi:hypothetical protein
VCLPDFDLGSRFFWDYFLWDVFPFVLCSFLECKNTQRVRLGLELGLEDNDSTIPEVCFDKEYISPL